MNNETRNILLWSIFGFIFISAVDGLILFSTHLLFIAKMELKVPFSIMQVSMSLTPLVLYLITGVMVFTRIKRMKSLKELGFATVPKGLFIGLCLVAITLAPISYKISGLYSANLPTGDGTDYVGYVNTYGWMTASLNFSRWLVLISLSIICFTKLKEKEN